MSLQESLAKLKAKLEGRLPKEVVKIMHQATADLNVSGIGEKILKVGDKAPEFSLPNQDGELVSSTELLDKDPLIITYYRGVWCPYCNVDLANLKKYKNQFDEFNATMISISPQLPEFNKQIIERQNLNFDLLSDAGNNVAHQFGLRWTLIDPLKSLCNDDWGINLPKYNGDDSWTLPITSRFIISTDGIISYAEYAIDYTKRPNPDVLINSLSKN